MAVSIGDLIVTIGAETKGLISSSQAAEKALGSLNDAMKNTVLGAAALGAAAATAGVAFVEHLVNKTLDTVKAQVTLAYQLGTTVESIQILQGAAKGAGLEAGAFTDTMGRMNQRLAEAARTGTGPAYEALRRVGLSAKDLIALPLDERLSVLAKTFQNLGLNVGQQGEVLKAFGVRGTEMISVFENGGAKIDKARQIVRDFGIALSDVDATMIAGATKQFKEAKLVVDGIGNQLTLKLVPAITLIGEAFMSAAKESKGFSDVLDAGIGFVVDVFAYLNNQIYLTKKNWYDFAGDIVDGANYLKNAINQIDVFFGVRNSFELTENKYRELSAALAVPPSSDQWRKALADRVELERAAAEKIVAERNKTKGSGNQDLDALTEAQRRALEQQLLALRKSIADQDAALDAQREEEIHKLNELLKKKGFMIEDAEQIREQIETKYQRQRRDLIQSQLEAGILTENEMLQRKYAKQLEDIEIFEKNRTITETQAADLRKKYVAKNALDILQLQAQQYSGLAGIVDTAMSSISQIVGKEGGAAFDIMKGISMATALVKGYEAVVSAFAAGSKIGGPPVGFAFAAIAAAGVAAQIAALAAVKPSSSGGGAATPTVAGGGDTGAAAATAAPAAGPSQTLYINGINRNALYSGDAVRDLADKLIQYQRDGGQVVLA